MCTLCETVQRLTPSVHSVIERTPVIYHVDQNRFYGYLMTSQKSLLYNYVANRKI
jgi:hypothetical protein